MSVERNALYLEDSASLSGVLPTIKHLLWKSNFTVYSLIKRGLDFILASLFLILLSPLFALIATLIKHEDGDPIFFKQLRTGQNGKNFYIYKFRTMVKDNDVLNRNCSDQHTKIGSFLRKTSLDELPQLINIVKGEMSFIGPRPWITEYYSVMNHQEKKRTLVKPGITGLAQANGRNGISIHEKIEYDLEYVKFYSIFTDIVVILGTIKAVLLKEDADAGKDIIHNELSELRAENRLYL